MKKSSYLLFLVSLMPFLSVGQITTNEYPPSFYSTPEKSTNSSLIYQVEKPDLKALEKQDKIEAKDKSIPWRFGTLIESNINLQNSGKWSVDSTGVSKWFMSIFAEDALSINLNFTKFQLSRNAKLYFYNNDYSDVLGAITAKNNKPDSTFSSRPIRGEQITIELLVPTSELEDCSFSIKHIIYGYRNIHEKAMKIFGGSSSCNININCPEGDNWQDVKRAVAMITAVNNTRLCTGTLLNNVRQDTTPYFLTAAHCGIRNNSIFIFNYESPNCIPSTDGILSNSISGASPKAVSNSVQPDFHLFELSSNPPSTYNVFYAGWSAINSPSQYTTTIHHPVGDVKKISSNTDSIYTSGYYNTTGNTHWTVNNWESGSTQGGSSGAPLFDQNQRVIGQLHGGEADCGNNAQDYFGKFAVSWNGLPAKSRQLKAWLDPDTTNVLVLDGLDPNPSNFNYDMQLIGVSGLSTYICDTIIYPKLSIRNRGNQLLDSIKITFQLDNGAIQTQTIIDNVLRNQVIEVNLASQHPLNSGTHRLSASIDFLSSTKNDQDTSNNSVVYNFQTNSTPIVVDFTLKTDDYGEETSWILESKSGTKLYGEGPFNSISGGSLFTRKLCLYDSCFNLTLFDSFNDGFNGIFGSGHALITGINGDTLVFEDNFTTTSKTLNFCVSSLTSLPKYKNSANPIKVIPNPVSRNGVLLIDGDVNKNNSYQLLDISGRLLLTFKTNRFELQNSIRPGIYFLLVKSDDTNEVINYQKIIVQ